MYRFLITYWTDYINGNDVYTSIVLEQQDDDLFSLYTHKDCPEHNLIKSIIKL